MVFLAGIFINLISYRLLFKLEFVKIIETQNLIGLNSLIRIEIIKIIYFYRINYFIKNNI